MRDASDLTITQAAEVLKVFPEQVESWVEKGTLLDAYALDEIGGIRIPRAVVEALKRNRVAEPPNQSSRETRSEQENRRTT